MYYVAFFSDEKVLFTANLFNSKADAKKYADDILATEGSLWKSYKLSEFTFCKD